VQFAYINNATIHYQVVGGGGDKPVLVFANSLGTDLRIWCNVAAQLAGDFTIVLYDKRGHGLSDLGQVPRVRRMIDWAIEQFDPQKCPWFRDDFIHPEEFGKHLRSSPSGAIDAAFGRP